MPRGLERDWKRTASLGDSFVVYNQVLDFIIIIRGGAYLVFAFWRAYWGCVRLGNPDLDFENLNLDFPIEDEIRKRISPPRNSSSGWISIIKKSKSSFFGFPFLSFDWEIRKRIYKTVLVNSGLLFTNYAFACKTAVPKDSFSNPFSYFPIEW